MLKNAKLLAYNSFLSVYDLPVKSWRLLAVFNKSNSGLSETRGEFACALRCRAAQPSQELSVSAQIVIGSLTHALKNGAFIRLLQGRRWCQTGAGNLSHCGASKIVLIRSVTSLHRVELLWVSKNFNYLIGLFRKVNIIICYNNGHG